MLKYMYVAMRHLYTSFKSQSGPTAGYVSLCYILNTTTHLDYIYRVLCLW